MNLSKNFSLHNVNNMTFAFKNKKDSIKSYLEKLFTFIGQSNPHYNALTSLQQELALKRACLLDEMDPVLARQLPLFGVPIIIKENIQKTDYPVECASKILKGYRGQFNATAIKNLEEAGAVIIGTANMDEFAMGSSNEHSAHGPVKNPYDNLCVSGGSSGGSAAACALGYAPLTLGSETGGSVRVPASFCGLFGFKPTYGRISRYGLVAYGSSFDQIAPFARTAKDLDIILQVIGKHDPMDATSLENNYVSCIDHTKENDFSNLTIGIPRSLLTKDVDASVMESFYTLQTKLEERGVTFENIEIEGSEHALSAYYLLACAEASSNLARFDGIRYGVRAKNTSDLYELYCKTRSEGFGFEVKKRIMLGTFALAAGYYDAFYGRAQVVRHTLSTSFKKIFKKVDFIYLPTTPTSAFKLGIHNHNSIQEYLYDMFTTPANLAQIPAISVPANVHKNKLPIGLQFIAGKEQDAKLIAFANLLEKHKLVGVRYESI